MNTHAKPLSLMIRSLLLLTPLLPAVGHAQEPLEMDEIKITAARGTQQADTLSRNITVVDKAELEQMQATSVPQTIGHLPNVTLMGGAA